MGFDALAAAILPAIAGGAEAAAPAAEAAAPEIFGTLIPGFTIGPEAAVAAGETAAAAGGATAADLAGGAGLGALLGISPALAGGLSPAARVSGTFDTANGRNLAMLNPGAPSNPPGQAVPISAVPGFGAGGTPLPTPAPVQAGAASPTGGAGAGSPGATPPADTFNALPGAPAPTIGPVAGDPTAAATAGAGVEPTGSTTGGASSLFGGTGNIPWGTLGTLGALSVGGQLLAPQIQSALGLNKVPGSQQLTGVAQTAGNLASTEAGIGTAEQQPLLTGVLPAGQQQVVDQAVKDAITTIKSRYAQLGLSGSSMEADAIASAQEQGVAQSVAMEQAMSQAGGSAVQNATSLLGDQSQIYSNILNAVIAQDQGLSNAISQFASSVGMGTALGSALRPTQTA